MIRSAYVCNKVLWLYREVPKIHFPINPLDYFQVILTCRVMSYKRFAELNGCKISDIYLICESKFGCTHYDKNDNRYLVLFNSVISKDNVIGRIRWTLAHELGHVVLNHLPCLAQNGFNSKFSPEYEAEADFFASQFLAPMPLFQELHIDCPAQIEKTFGLSHSAALRRWDNYNSWRRFHRRTPWENDIKHIYNKSRV